jgi:hypothetical protein
MQRTSPETWQAVEKAVCAGMGYTEAARRFGIHSPHTIMMRARRNKWPVPARIKQRTLALQQAVTRRAEAYEALRERNQEITETIAESWAEKGERHRAHAFEMATKALQKAANQDLPLHDWQDIDRADKIARRAAGLDNDKSAKVSVSLNLVNQRILALQNTEDPFTKKRAR